MMQIQSYMKKLHHALMFLPPQLFAAERMQLHPSCTKRWCVFSWFRKGITLTDDVFLSVVTCYIGYSFPCVDIVICFVSFGCLLMLLKIISESESDPFSGSVSLFECFVFYNIFLQEPKNLLIYIKILFLQFSISVNLRVLSINKMVFTEH